MSMKATKEIQRATRGTSASTNNAATDATRISERASSELSFIGLKFSI